MGNALKLGRQDFQTIAFKRCPHDVQPLKLGNPGDLAGIFLGDRVVSGD